MAAPGPLSLEPVTAEDEASQMAARFQLTLPGQRLAAALARVAFAMAKQDVRYYLNGVHLEWTGASLLLVATDGHRLADSGIQATVRGGYGQAILPAETVAMLARLGQEAGDADLVLTLSPRLLRVEQGGVELISKLIDGKYPDWRRVVPAGPAASTWTLPVEDLKRALLRVSVLCHEKFRGVKFHVPEHDRTALVLSAVNEDKEDAEETLPLATPSQQPLTIGFNLDYVLSVLGACPTETITWELTSGSASAKLVPGTSIADETQDDPEWVVMPMLL
jgi:DNA polymerase-3 subunit beta